MINITKTHLSYKEKYQKYVDEVFANGWVTNNGPLVKKLAMALASNSGIHVGIEDNIWFDKNRKKLTTNSALLERVHQLLKISELKMMTSREPRECLY